MKTLERNCDLEELVAAVAPGWPRARLRVAGRATPLPWVNGLEPALAAMRDGWKALVPTRNRACEDERLCFCCGEALLKLSIMGRHRASFVAEKSGRRVWLTDGPPGHPRCLALAAAHCPHLREQHRGRADFVIAFSWDRPSVGYVETPAEIVTSGEPRFLVRPGAETLTLGELRRLAASDPLGAG